MNGSLSDPRELRRPFADFADLPPRASLRAAISASRYRPEPELIPALLEQARLPAALREPVRALATRLAEGMRRRGGGRAGRIQSLLHEYSLSSQEGIALMCLAEALLRIPDPATRDALIRDKIGAGDWRRHLGHASSVFVNAATWGLLLTGELAATRSEAGLSSALTRLLGRSGEPLIRKSVDVAMRLLGEQFVTGRTIAEALARARPLEAEGFRYSYDMLGEAALTAADTSRYFAAYEQAIQAIGEAADRRGIYEGPGISVKLSALHPRYARAQRPRVLDELYPRLRALALLARRYDIGLNIDAEEADRLELSLDLLERLCAEPGLAGWNGIGFAVQAYQKRCPFVIDHLIDLAHRSGHRLMIRLVKGAYWDGEIKSAQVLGLEDYPVFTRKPHTDLCFLACARRLLAAPNEVFPQFATHNARTLAAIHHLAGPEFAPGRYEFQCLHGMGEPLYRQVVGPLGRPCRIYAPVGSHETLLAYLVRRLLENGANTSFVNRLADPHVAIDELVADPVSVVESLAAGEGRPGLPHPRIPLPRALYGAARVNSRGLDLSDEHALATLADALCESAGENWRAAPMLGGEAAAGESRAVLNPADHRDVVGQVREASDADVDAAIACAVTAGRLWRAVSPAERASVLERAADTLESECPRLVGLLVREAGKTVLDAVSEVREAADFLRYYAAQARREFSNDTHRPLGPVACISPWNFPLAIFTGQVAAALAAGNSVLAKPAGQTPLIAAQAVRILREAGVPPGVLQLLPGSGETVGARLVADARVRGVVFTGSTEVARQLQRSIAGRVGPDGDGVPLIAETGGLNALIVDSSALAEQVVGDVIASAFNSAGQRCSALRVLCLQEEIADRTLSLLEGAMAEYRVGNPDRLAVDIGPVIDADARDGIERHIEAMRAKGRRVFQAASTDPEECAHGSFVTPTLIELEAIGELTHEVFGPVLHVVRYRREELRALLERIGAAGYGLTMGLHTRIDETIAEVAERARVGNLYVNRNMIGAVVGVQPFGGEGLSGTGPKAGGPLYLYRLLSARPAAALQHSLERNAALPGASRRAALLAPLYALHGWARGQGLEALTRACERFARESPSGTAYLLAGPTGERNSYHLQPRERVLCLADDEADRLIQLAAVLAVGARALWPSGAAGESLRDRLPETVAARIDLTDDWTGMGVTFDAALHHGSPEQLRSARVQLSQRPGPIAGVHGRIPGDAEIPLDRLLIERAISLNTAASGGNASLLVLG